MSELPWVSEHTIVIAARSAAGLARLGLAGVLLATVTLATWHLGHKQPKRALQLLRNLRLAAGLAILLTILTSSVALLGLLNHPTLVVSWYQLIPLRWKVAEGLATVVVSWSYLWLARARLRASMSARCAVVWAGAVAATVGVVVADVPNAARTFPNALAEAGQLLQVWQSGPWTLWALSRTAAGLALGACGMTVLASWRKQAGVSQSAATLSWGACVCCAAGVLAGIASASTDAMLRVPPQPPTCNGDTGRYAAACAIAWLSAAAITALGALGGRPVRKAPSMLALAAVVSAFGMVDVARWYASGSWEIPGVMYANGVSHESVGASRQVPFLSSGASEEFAGHAVFVGQCQTCHNTHDQIRQHFADLSLPGVEATLQSLRGADDWTNPQGCRMPPLVGSDGEVHALARWTVDRSPPQPPDAADRKGPKPYQTPLRWFILVGFGLGAGFVMTRRFRSRSRHRKSDSKPPED